MTQSRPVVSRSQSRPASGLASKSPKLQNHPSRKPAPKLLGRKLNQKQPGKQASPEAAALLYVNFILAVAARVHLLKRYKFQASAVDAVSHTALISRSVLEDVPQMAASYAA